MSGKLPKDGYLLGDLEIRQIIETFAEDEAIFTAVCCSPSLNEQVIYTGPCSVNLPLKSEAQDGHEGQQGTEWWSVSFHLLGHLEGHVRGTSFTVAQLFV